MARGPLPDADQAAKGYPGKRRSRADAAAVKAARIARLLEPANGVRADTPALLQDPRFEPAANVWRRLAPELRRTHRLPIESEFYFVQLCIYAQEWVTATEDLHVKGFTQSVAAVAGGKMERRRPQTLDRQQAYANCLGLSEKFGLTPHDMYSLFKGQALVAATNPGLFGEERKVTPEAEPAAAPSRIGGMEAMRSEAPRLN